LIWESYYWKQPLLESAKRLQKLSELCSFEDAEMVRLEKDIFIGFFSIRKLMDTFKISDATKSHEILIHWFPNIKKVDYLNNHRIDDLYDLDNRNSENRTLRFICDQIVHSYVFVPLDNEHDGLDGFYIASDRTKNSRVYFLSIQDVISIFTLVGNDYPSSSRFVRDAETGEFKAKVW
tara:strand:+ start:1265 stop:1798 length:534 start_codon:yes stop_codon:yes gene_type:complete